MLAFALILSGDETHLRTTLASLAANRPKDHPLVLINPGTNEGHHDLGQVFVRRNGGQIITTDGPPTRSEAAALARHHTGMPYALSLKPKDQLYGPGVKALAAKLTASDPDVIVLGSGWGHPGTGQPIPGPDAERIANLPLHPAAADLLDLYPDLRRVLIRNNSSTPPVSKADTLAIWRAWETVLEAPEQVLFCPDPVILPPLPHQSAAGAMMALSTQVSTLKKSDFSAKLDRYLTWTGDALRLSPPAAALETIEAATLLLAALPRAFRSRACKAPEPIGPFLNAVRRGHHSEAMARLALLVSARTDLQIAALSDGFVTLRQDLDVALPGPDYLMDLYTRLRGI